MTSLADLTQALLRPWPATSGMTQPKRWWIGFSGGLDSTALMLIASQLLADGRAVAHGVQIRAVHVHHGLQPAADAWAEHCERIAAQLGIPLTVLRLGLKPKQGASIEALARHARYRALAHLLDADMELQGADPAVEAKSQASRAIDAATCFITAHHRDDQLETVLLQWLRGAGPEGLAAMPTFGRVYGCPVWRPLLDQGRDSLQALVQTARLPWIEDPMNADPALRRSQIRHQLVPLVRRLAPSANQTLLRSAAWCAEAAQAQQELAALDLAACVDPQQKSLLVEPLKRLSDARQKAVLRAWLPEIWPAARLAMLQQQACDARQQARPQVGSPTLQVYRWREALWQWRPLPLPEPSVLDMGAAESATPERLAMALQRGLQGWPGRLHCTWADDGQHANSRPESRLVPPTTDQCEGGQLAGLPLSMFCSPSGLSWVPMTGQRRMRRRIGEPSRSLKQWVQRDEGLAPWLRPFYPVLIVPKPGFPEQGTVLWSAFLGMHVDHLVTSGPRVLLHWESTLPGASAADI